MPHNASSYEQCNSLILLAASHNTYTTREPLQGNQGWLRDVADLFRSKSLRAAWRHRRHAQKTGEGFSLQGERVHMGFLVEDYHEAREGQLFTISTEDQMKRNGLSLMDGSLGWK